MNKICTASVVIFRVTPFKDPSNPLNVTQVLNEVFIPYYWEPTYDCLRFDGKTRVRRGTLRALDRIQERPHHRFERKATSFLSGIFQALSPSRHSMYTAQIQ